MAILKDNWFLEPIFDFEYKSYQILGYTKLLNSHFESCKFYPYLDGLSKHLSLLSAYQEAKENLESRLEREIETLDFKNKRIQKKPVEDTEGIISALQEIISFGKSEMQNCYTRATSSYEAARKEIEINPLGLLGTNTNQGILFFRRPDKTRVYSYSVRMVMRPGPGDVYKDVKTTYLDALSTGPFTNFNNIKSNIIKTSAFDIGTTAYLIDTNTEMPYFELVLPVVKKYIIELSR